MSHAVITTKSGHQIIVDDDDFAWLSQYKWYLVNGYACTNRAPGFKNRNVRMHRLILGLGDSDDVGDHINCVKLDNRRANLRVADRRQSAWNRRRFRTNTTGFGGVSVQDNKYKASCMAGNTCYGGGLYANLYEAAFAADALRIALHGQFAKLNFPLCSTGKFPKSATSQHHPNSWLAGQLFLKRASA
jgi:hypothetical protein